MVNSWLENIIVIIDTMVRSLIFKCRNSRLFLPFNFIVGYESNSNFSVMRIQNIDLAVLAFTFYLQLTPDSNNILLRHFSVCWSIGLLLCSQIWTKFNKHDEVFSIEKRSDNNIYRITDRVLKLLQKKIILSKIFPSLKCLSSARLLPGDIRIIF